MKAGRWVENEDKANISVSCTSLDNVINLEQ